MPLTPKDVAEKSFTSVRFKRGYHEDQVDAFLDEVEGELTRLLAELDRLRAAAGSPPAAPAVPGTASTADGPAALPAGLVPSAPVVGEQGSPGATDRLLAPSPTEDMLRRTLLLAQRAADEAVAQARLEAEQLLSGARARAAQTDRSAALEHAAAQRRRRAEQEALGARLEELRRMEREHRDRLRAYLTGQLRELDGRGALPLDKGATGPDERALVLTGSSADSSADTERSGAYEPPVHEPSGSADQAAVEDGRRQDTSAAPSGDS